MSLTGFGARSLIPDEHLEGYGPHASLTNGYLWRPGAPLRGHATRQMGYPTPPFIAIEVGLSEFRENGTRVNIWQSTYDAIVAGIGRPGGTPHPNPQVVFRWRAQGTSDAWKEVPGATLGVSLSTVDSKFTEGARVVGFLTIEDRRLDPTDPDYDASAPDLPAHDEIVEFYLIGSIPPDEFHPVVIEGITAGQVAVNTYAGIYSPRDPTTGAVIPTGIRYDEPTFAQMPELVRIRLDKPVEDARDWLEKVIYAPTGFAPTLDLLGRISPVSQIPPDDLTGLPVIDDAMTEPTHEWDAGQQIINVVRFTYLRDFSTGPPDPDGDLKGEDVERRQDLLDERPIIIEIKNDLSIERFGEQVLELDGSAFRAIGRGPETVEEADLDPGNIPMRRPREVERFGRRKFSLLAPLTQRPIVRTGQHVIPASGDIQDETGWQLAQLRGLHILNRWAFGAPTVTLRVMWSGVPTVRCGSWVWLNLKQFPDYVTQRRGLFALAQVVSLGVLDCAWRRLRCEIVAPIEEES